MRSNKAGKKTETDQVYVINPLALEIGDIVLSAANPTDLASRLIRMSTRGNYCHAAICTRVGLLMEAKATNDGSGGVRRSSIIRIVADDPVSLRVLRLRQDVPKREVIASGAAARAEWMLHRLYWTGGVLSFLPSKLIGKISPNKRQAFFCSHLVAAMYRHAELDLLPGVAPELTAPSAFLNSGKLEDVTDQVLRVQNEAIAWANAPKDDESPHTRIEQAVNQRMLSDPAVLAIIAKYRQPRPSGYFDLLTFLAKTRDPKLDKIMAAGVDEVATGFRREWSSYGNSEDSVRAAEQSLCSAALTPTEIEAKLSNLESIRVILKDDIKCRQKDVGENRKIAERAGGLKTFEKRMLFSKEYLTFMCGQLELLEHEARLLSSYLSQYPSERIYSRLRFADSFGLPMPGRTSCSTTPQPS